LYQLLRVLPLYFILIVLPRVALHTNKYTLPGNPNWPFNFYDILGVLFALGLGTGVYIFSYYSTLTRGYEKEEITEAMTANQKGSVKRKNREIVTRATAARRATIAAYLFAILDSMFNLAEVLSVAVATGILTSPTTPGVGENYLTLFSVYVFGIFPTVAIFVAGWVRSALDQIPGFEVGLNILGKRRTVTKSVTPKEKPKVKKQSKPRSEDKQEFLAWARAEGLTTETARARKDEIMGRFNVKTRSFYRWTEEI
jgi:uncharacterized membrane protein